MIIAIRINDGITRYFFRVFFLGFAPDPIPNVFLLAVQGQVFISVFLRSFSLKFWWLTDILAQSRSLLLELSVQFELTVEALSLSFSKNFSRYFACSRFQIFHCDLRPGHFFVDKLILFSCYFHKLVLTNDHWYYFHQLSSNQPWNHSCDQHFVKHFWMTENLVQSRSLSLLLSVLLLFSLESLWLPSSILQKLFPWSPSRIFRISDSRFVQFFVQFCIL